MSWTNRLRNRLRKAAPRFPRQSTSRLRKSMSMRSLPKCFRLNRKMSLGRAARCGSFSSSGRLDPVPNDPAEQMSFHEFPPDPPIVAPGLVQKDDREQHALPGLQEGQDFECLVECAEPPGKKRHPLGLLDEKELAGKEIFHVDELGVARDDPVGAVLEGKEDVDPHRQVLARADVGGFHYPLATPRDD